MMLLLLKNKIVTLFAVALLTVSLAMPAQANKFETKADFAYLYDYNSGTVILDKNGDVPMGPSSMTKLMTIYLLFDALKRGDLTMDSMLPVSEKAWKKGGSKMFVREGTDVSVSDLLRGIVIQSGNDACIVVAEGLSGSEKAFAEDMNFVGEKIGLTGSDFRNSTGWPDKNHVMTARDLVVLSKRLIEDYPEYYKIFAETEFTYNKIRQPNRNRLLYRDIGVDGLKTGHTEAAGYGIVTSAEQNGRRLILAINGLKTEKERITEAERLLRHGFRDFKSINLYKKDQTIETAKVWFGNSDEIQLIADEDISLLVANRISQRADIKLELSYQSPIPAPIKKGDELAKLVIKEDGEVKREVPLYAKNDVEKLSFFGRLMALPSYYLSEI